MPSNVAKNAGLDYKRDIRLICPEKNSSVFLFTGILCCPLKINDRVFFVAVFVQTNDAHSERETHT